MSWADVKTKALIAFAERLPPCDEVCQALSRSLDEPLGFRERIRIRLHLWICDLCERFGQQLELLRKIAQKEEGGSSRAQLSPEAREKIKQLLKSG